MIQYSQVIRCINQATGNYQRLFDFVQEDDEQYLVFKENKMLSRYNLRDIKHLIERAQEEAAKRI